MMNCSAGYTFWKKTFGRKNMWDVVVTVTLMAFGVFMVVAVGMIFIAAIYFLQNGDRDD